jgi:UDP-N-acetylmuramate dehydrogenase
MFSDQLASRNRVQRRDLAGLTTMRIGGPAWVVELEERADLPELLARPLRWLGRGANLLVGDDGVEETVVRLGRRFAGLAIGRPAGGFTTVEAGAGLDLAELIRACVDAGLAGPEGLAGVPATVGGALRMNAGTSTCWTLDWVDEVEVLLPGEAAPRWIPRAAMAAGYRDCGMPRGTVFLGCRLRLASADPEQLRAQAGRLKKAKAATQPLALPSAGCVFRNPRPDLPAGRLIDELGLKGARVGGAVVSEVHANFIVNPGRGASAHDVCTLIRQVRERAWRERGISLQLEVETWSCPEQLLADPSVLIGAGA